jgi:cell division protein ZipA
VAELRWILLILGAVVLLGIYIFSRYKIWPRDRGRDETPARQEPAIEVGDPPASVQDSNGGDRGLAALPPGTRATGPDQKIITIRLMARTEAGIPGERLILALREAGMSHGEFGIFHRRDTDDESKTWYSVASLVEPGSFDLTRLKTDCYPGISIFLVLPGPADEIVAFDDMLKTARRLAQQLDGELLDEQGSNLSVQRERYLREELIQHQHRVPDVS